MNELDIVRMLFFAGCAGLGALTCLHAKSLYHALAIFVFGFGFLALAFIGARP